MRLRHIEVFHAIYTNGSITNAAKMLHVSQPSVSKVLSHAEMQLGFKLFERIKGRLIPTDEANMLFDEVDKIYQQMRSIKSTAENIKKAEFGNINLSVTPALGFDALPNAIAQYHKTYPNVHFNVQTVHNNEVLQALLEHKCDIAILFSPCVMPSVKSIELAQSELVIVYPKTTFPELPEQLTLNNLVDLEFIDISDSGPLGNLLWGRMMEEHIVINSTIKVQTYFIAARLVAQGAGICIVDKYTALGNLSDNVAIASFNPPLNFTVNALHLENSALSKASVSFLDKLTTCI
ncbi:LysR family transcriptional regulator [Pseudoalteromonas sp. SWXJZ94C]|uniref:LysR family transcriptional regulator n=1 Tax=unclassified Pseudoalteromonas TaxID=194690 RepID=UPI00040B6A2E|nr:MULTISPECIES: LysR family transcriptional regulator [unclassified Pseudoalteromonas]MBH0057224.1 LysR family transcriptional regulator [Pseudoalteromonas sp. SWXJZ94C]